jgi:OmpA-OmpF porin, OOP family
MRKLAITLALATTAITTPALARDDSWYIGVEGGASILEDAKINIRGATAATSGIGTVNSDTGYDFDGIIGYDFGGFRLEAEVGYKAADLGTYASTTTTRFTSPPNANNFNAPAGTFPLAGGETTALSFMLNGMLDFGEDDGVQGFVGGGAGVARVKHNGALNASGVRFLNDSDTGLAWQAIAGVRAPLSDHWDVGLKYRFFNAPNVDLIDAGGRANSTRYRSHSILGSLIYNFGGEAPPPPVVAPLAPPPPETPPPAPPVVQCTPGPYIVFFEWDKSDITADAAGILDNAVSAYGNCGNAQVMLAGHADKSGTPKYNVGLSERRNASVRSYLGGHGIPDGVVTNQAFGEGAPRVETADGVRELQNRRVEITYGPGSGQ